MVGIDASEAAQRTNPYEIPVETAENLWLVSIGWGVTAARGTLGVVGDIVMSKPISAAFKARRLAAELENNWTDARALGLHQVADAIEFARNVLGAVALAQFNLAIDDLHKGEIHTPQNEG